MTHVIRVLKREHDRQRQLLGLMDDLLAHMVSGGDPDFRLLADIAEYLTGYPDQVHHPKEDLIYRRLRKRTRSAADGPGNLVREHEDLSAMTAAFAAAVGEGEKNPAGWRRRIEDNMRRLIDSQLHHLEMEERYFFPEAIDKLTQSDWEEVTFAIAERLDPLFDEATVRFERLRGHILGGTTGTGSGEQPLEPAFEPLPDIDQVTTLAAFNSASASVGSSLRLDTGDDGGYVLSGDRHRLSFPNCDERIAAWCAWCYLAGCMTEARRRSDSP